MHIEPFNTVHKKFYFCFLCSSRLLKLGDFAEYFSPCHSLLPVSMSLPINELPYYISIQKFSLICKFHNAKHSTHLDNIFGTFQVPFAVVYQNFGLSAKKESFQLSALGFGRRN